MSAVIAGYDPACRYVQRDPGELPLHVCTNREGAMVQPGQDCFYEARTQLRELSKARAVLREAGS